MQAHTLVYVWCLLLQDPDHWPTLSELIKVRIHPAHRGRVWRCGSVFALSSTFGTSTECQSSSLYCIQNNTKHHPCLTLCPSFQNTSLPLSLPHSNYLCFCFFPLLWSLLRQRRNSATVGWLASHSFKEYCPLNPPIHSESWPYLLSA